MARPRSHSITVRLAPHADRVKAWKATWRETDPVTGTRRDASKFFDTEAEAIAFKVKHESAGVLPPRRPAPDGARHAEQEDLRQAVEHLAAAVQALGSEIRALRADVVAHKDAIGDLRRARAGRTH